MKNSIVAALIIVLSVLPGSEGWSFQSLEFEYAGAFGEKGSDPGECRNPMGISVDVEGNIYIADTGNNRIQKFSNDGKFIVFYGGFGWGNDQFYQPVSIYAATGLDIYVADRNNHRISRFDSNLNYISSLNLDAVTDDLFRFKFPDALVVTSIRDKFIIDSENGRIVRFNAFDVPDAHFGGYNSNGIPLKSPARIAEYNEKFIYVSDTGHGGVVVYDYFGNYIEIIGDDILNVPAGLSCDNKGNLYVCDSGSHDVKVFDQNGRKISVITNPGFKSPADISCYNDTLYILDQETSLIYLYRIKNK